MGSISLRLWAESSYDRPSERRVYPFGVSMVYGPSEIVISGVTDVTTFLGARRPGQISWMADGSRAVRPVAGSQTPSKVNQLAH